MRKFVTPNPPEATIPDPERGRDLPPEGAPVTWSAYWAARQMREEITVADLPEAGAEPEVLEADPAAQDAEIEPEPEVAVPAPEPSAD